MTSSMEPAPSIRAVRSKLQAIGIALPPGRVRLTGYGDSAAQSEELLSLIGQGRKRAGTSLLWAMEAENAPLPRAGDIDVVLDHRNEPVCIARIVQVSVVPYHEVTAEYAAIEGEGDKSLEFWRGAHWAFFSRECGRIGREPAESMPVVCSIFEVLNVLSSPTAACPIGGGRAVGADIGRHVQIMQHSSSPNFQASSVTPDPATGRTGPPSCIRQRQLHEALQ
jgi:uncharacterized protein YhfF